MKRYALLMLLVIGLSACTIRFDIGVEVNEDESGSFVVFMGLDQEMRELMEQSGGEDMSITDQLASDAPEGFDVEEYSEDGFDGVRISTTFTSFEDLNKQLSETSTEAGSPTDMVNGFEFTHEGDEFRFSADVAGLGEGFTDAVGQAGGDELSGFDASFMADLFEINFKLTLPGDIQEHNADSIDGNTLNWELTFDEERDALVAVSSTAGGSSLMLIGGAAVAVAAIAGIGVAASRRKKKSAVDAVAAASDAPPFDPVS